MNERVKPPTFQTLTEAVEELERSNPDVAEAAAKLSDTKLEILARQEVHRICGRRWDEEPCGPTHRFIDRAITMSGPASRVRMNQRRVREGKRPFRGSGLR